MLKHRLWKAFVLIWALCGVLWSHAVSLYLCSVMDDVDDSVLFQYLVSHIASPYSSALLYLLFSLHHPLCLSGFNCRAVNPACNSCKIPPICPFPLSLSLSLSVNLSVRSGGFHQSQWDSAVVYESGLNFYIQLTQVVMVGLKAGMVSKVQKCFVCN